MTRSNELQAANSFQQTVVPIARAAGAANGAAVNLLASTMYEEGVLVASCGAATGSPTAQSITVKLQESADGSTGWADVTDLAEVEAASVVLDADNQIKTLAFYPGAVKQYIRAVATVAFTGGTTPAIPCEVAVILGKPQRF